MTFEVPYTAEENVQNSPQCSEYVHIEKEVCCNVSWHYTEVGGWTWAIRTPQQILIHTPNNAFCQRGSTGRTLSLRFKFPIAQLQVNRKKMLQACTNLRRTPKSL